MSYETAPATKMMKSYCGICGRKVVDGQSIETGVGPKCRKEYLVAEAISEEARKEGNAIIYRLAQIHKPSNSQEKREVILALSRLKELGMLKAVERIRQHLGKRLSSKPRQDRKMQKIRIRKQGNRIIVSTPYVPGFVQDSKQVKGRWWHRQEKVNSFPVERKREVYNLLRKHFAGAPAEGPKGAFVV